MKRIIILIVVVLQIYSSYGQNYWFKTIPSEYYQGPSGDIILHDDHFIIPIVEEYNDMYYDEYYSGYIKVSQTGEIEYTGLLRQDAFNLIGTTIIKNNGNICGLGHIYIEDENSSFALWQIELNDELEIIHQKVDTLDMHFGYIMNSFVKNNNIYFHNLTSNVPFQFGLDNVYLARLDQNNNIIIDTLIEKWSYDFESNVLNENIIIQTNSLDPNYANFNQVNQLDTNFNFINTVTSFNPDSLSYFFSIHLSSDSNYYFSAMRHREDAFWVDSHAVLKTSSDFDQLHYKDFDTIPYWHFTPDHNGIDTYENYVYTGGNFEYRGMQQTYPNYFTLTKMDTDLNIINQRYYGGDNNYLLNTIKTTTEGDVILAGRYSKLDTDIWNIFIMKVDENGLITSNKNQIDIPIKNAIIMPNPGTNYLELHTGVYPSELQLYNIKGQLIKSENIYKESSRINTQTLKSSTYIWHLVKDNELIETGKWLKL